MFIGPNLTHGYYAARNSRDPEPFCNVFAANRGECARRRRHCRCTSWSHGSINVISGSRAVGAPNRVVNNKRCLVDILCDPGENCWTRRTILDRNRTRRAECLSKWCSRITRPLSWAHANDLTRRPTNVVACRLSKPTDVRSRKSTITC